jgi:hypothetical protein
MQEGLEAAAGLAFPDNTAIFKIVLSVFASEEGSTELQRKLKNNTC